VHGNAEVLATDAKVIAGLRKRLANAQRGRNFPERQRPGQQPVHLDLDGGVALAGTGLQADPVQHVAVAAPMLDLIKGHEGSFCANANAFFA
jgi:hypothetical protein